MNDYIVTETEQVIRYELINSIKVYEIQVSQYKLNQSWFTYYIVIKTESLWTHNESLVTALMWIKVKWIKTYNESVAITLDSIKVNVTQVNQTKWIRL